MEKHNTARQASDIMDEERKSRDLEHANHDDTNHPIEKWADPNELDTNSTPLEMSPDGEEGSGVVKQISRTRIVALTIIMIMTYFLGVSTLGAI